MTYRTPVPPWPNLRDPVPSESEFHGRRIRHRSSWVEPPRLSNLLTLPEALVHQNFDIYVTVEFTVIGVLVADCRMGGSITDRHQNAP